MIVKSVHEIKAPSLGDQIDIKRIMETETNTTKKNIIIYGPFPPPVSGATVSNQLVLNILKAHYNVFLINTSAGFLKPKNNIIYLIKYSIISFLIYLKILLSIARITNKYKIHAFYFLPSCNTIGHLKDSIILFLYGRRLGKIIAQLHNSNFRILFEKKVYRSFTFAYYKRISVFIFSSKTLSEECAKYLSKERRTYFYNTINPKVTCCDVEINSKFNSRINNSHFNILFVGHMLYSKGCFDLLKGMYLFNLIGKYSISVTFIGGWIDSQEEKEFNCYLNKNQMEGYVECLGIVQDPAILKQKYLASDILVLPTYYPYESQPLAIIDAMNAGNPIISTDQGTISEFVNTGVNGFVIEKHNPQEICDSIEKLMDRNLWLKFAKQARKDFIDKFSHNIYEDNLLNIFQ